MKIKTIPSTWVENNGCRLDCGPYMSGAFEAKVLLENLCHQKEPLSELTSGGLSGIFKGKMVKRIFVNDKDYGVPFLNTSDMLAADLSNLALLSKRVAVTDKSCFVSEGTTLVSAAGTIGRTAYVRKEMEGMFACSDIMKIVPDPTKILPGYLYAFLSSKFGVPLLTSGTFGSIILHIEPFHIANVPVPRLGDIEQEASKLVEKSAALRSEASETIRNAIQRMKSEARLAELPMDTGSVFDVSVASSRDVFSRLEGFFHSNYHSAAKDAVRGSTHGSQKVSDIAQSIVEPTRFKRIQVEPSETSVPFFGTTSLLWATPKPIYHLAERQRNISDYLVSRNTVLIPRSGQISGLIGSPILPYGELVGGAITEDAIRINCADEIDAGYLFVALGSEYGKRQLKARAYGSSIPHLDITQIGQVEVPKLPEEVRNEIGMAGLDSAIKRGKAIELEEQAVALVECAIEEGGR